MKIHEYIERHYQTDIKYRGQIHIIHYILEHKYFGDFVEELHLGISWRDGGFVDTFVAEIDNNMIWIVTC